MQPVTVKVKPIGNVPYTFFGVYIYVAGQWELEGTYTRRIDALIKASYYKKNKQNRNAFTQKVLHRRKYPIVK